MSDIKDSIVEEATVVTEKLSGFKVFVRKLYLKGIVTGLLAVCFVASLIWATMLGQDVGKAEAAKRQADKDKQRAEARVVEYDLQLKTATVFVDSVRGENIVLSTKIADLLKERAIGLNREKNIKTKYNELYHALNSSNDSEQLNNLISLLAAHSRLPFEKN